MFFVQCLEELHPVVLHISALLLLSPVQFRFRLVEKDETERGSERMYLYRRAENIYGRANGIYGRAEGIYSSAEQRIYTVEQMECSVGQMV